MTAEVYHMGCQSCETYLGKSLNEIDAVQKGSIKVHAKSKLSPALLAAACAASIVGLSVLVLFGSLVIGTIILGAAGALSLSKKILEKMRETKVEWVLVESQRKSAKSHYIFTTTSRHAGEEDVYIRAKLNAKATQIANKLFDGEYRLINNSGKTCSSMTHYHAHIVSPGENEVLPRAVANVGKVIDDSDASDEVKVSLKAALLQNKS